MAKQLKQNSITALDMVEQAVYQIKTLSADILFYYYLGTIPFVLGVLYFFNDMSKNAYAHEYCITASFGLAVLFIWMKAWQAVFCMKTYAAIGQESLPKRTIGFIIHVTITQTIIHTSAIIVLPIAALITIPFAWTFAMYQMALVPAGLLSGTGKQQTDTGSVMKIIQHNWKIATNYTFINHMIITILCLFGIFVFINVAISIYTFPFLLKGLFGVESVFTLGGFSIFNTTFVMAAMGITYLLIDPLFKIVYTIQKFHFDAQKTGNDLISGLNQFKKKTQKHVLVSLLLVCFFFPQLPIPTAASSPVQPKPISQDAHTNPISSRQLDNAIEHVLSQPEYHWKQALADTQKQNLEKSILYKISQWVTTQLKRFTATIENWMERIYDFIRKLFDKKPGPTQEPEKPSSLIKPGYLSFALILLMAGLLIAVFVHLRKFKTPKDPKSENTQAIALDLNDENILADQLARDQWMELASTLIEKGQIRLAIRAVYLGTLAQLSDQHMIRIAQYKSNRDYQRELSQKMSNHASMLEDFSYLVQTVDRVWYGMHEANQPLYDTFLSTQKRMVHIEPR